MGRLLSLIGIIMMIGGGFGLGGSILQPIGDIVSSVNPEAIAEQASELCNDAETIEVEQGQETYSPSSGWARPSYFYCVDGQGNRREVTQEFGAELIGTTTSTALSAFSSAFLWMGVSTIGFFLLIIGIIVSVRKRAKSANMLQYGSSSPISGNPAMHWNMPQTSATTSPKSDISDLKDRLQKLEEARSANLISQDEYDRLRQNILDKL